MNKLLIFLLVLYLKIRTDNQCTANLQKASDNQRSHLQQYTYACVTVYSEERLICCDNSLPDKDLKHLTRYNLSFAMLCSPIQPARAVNISR